MGHQPVRWPSSDSSDQAGRIRPDAASGADSDARPLGNRNGRGDVKGTEDANRNSENVENGVKGRRDCRQRSEPYVARRHVGALSAHCRRENGSVWAAVNAPSHWIWGNPALGQHRPSVRYTVAGVLVHHLSSGFWALVHTQSLRHVEPGNSLRAHVAGAGLITVLAAAVDLAVVPHRLTPGFQHHLSAKALFGVYAMFGIGLLAGTLFTAARDRRRLRAEETKLRSTNKRKTGHEGVTHDG